MRSLKLLVLGVDPRTDEGRTEADAWTARFHEGVDGVVLAWDNWGVFALPDVPDHVAQEYGRRLDKRVVRVSSIEAALGVASGVEDAVGVLVIAPDGHPACGGEAALDGWGVFEGDTEVTDEAVGAPNDRSNATRLKCSLYRVAQA